MFGGNRAFEEKISIQILKDEGKITGTFSLELIPHEGPYNLKIFYKNNHRPYDISTDINVQFDGSELEKFNTKFTSPYDFDDSDTEEDVSDSGNSIGRGASGLGKFNTPAKGEYTFNYTVKNDGNLPDGMSIILNKNMPLYTNFALAYLIIVLSFIGIKKFKSNN